MDDVFLLFQSDKVFEKVHNEAELLFESQMMELFIVANVLQDLSGVLGDQNAEAAFRFVVAAVLRFEDLANEGIAVQFFAKFELIDAVFLVINQVVFG